MPKLAYDDPTPTNGKPYYCVACKKGYDDYLKCEDLDCELESDAAAQMRASGGDS